jgi:hypothetical protein
MAGNTSSTEVSPFGVLVRTSLLAGLLVALQYGIYNLWDVCTAADQAVGPVDTIMKICLSVCSYLEKVNKNSIVGVLSSMGLRSGVNYFFHEMLLVALQQLHFLTHSKIVHHVRDWAGFSWIPKLQAHADTYSRLFEDAEEVKIHHSNVAFLILSIACAYETFKAWFVPHVVKPRNKREARIVYFQAIFHLALTLWTSSEFFAMHAITLRALKEYLVASEHLPGFRLSSAFGSPLLPKYFVSASPIGIIHFLFPYHALSHAIRRVHAAWHNWTRIAIREEDAGSTERRRLLKLALADSSIVAAHSTETNTARLPLADKNKNLQELNELAREFAKRNEANGLIRPPVSLLRKAESVLDFKRQRIEDEREGVRRSGSSAQLGAWAMKSKGNENSVPGVTGGCRPKVERHVTWGGEVRKSS